MVYNRQYNTRNSTGGGRYNNAGQFVTAGAQQQQQQQFQPPLPPSTPQYQPQRNVQNVQQSNNKPANPKPQQFQNNEMEGGDVEMKPDPDADMGNSEDSGTSRPPWMKSKLPGVKKISKKEKRRRQNEHLRRLITPKNALMVLNEMMLHDQLPNVSNQFKVEAAEGPNQYYKSQKTSFCADLTLDGVTYKGYGENKLMARNAAAEQAIRDLIIKRMQKAANQDINMTDALTGAAAGTSSDEEDPLPMIQLASFALHKLFSEWEFSGHKVPQLKPPTTSISEGDAETASVTSPRPKPKKVKELPANASSMHPAMLLTYMRPQLEYRELAVTGDRPQSMLFTMGVDVDGATYIGKASNKKEARKAAARAACTALFGVTFDEHPAPAATATAAS